MQFRKSFRGNRRKTTAAEKSLMRIESLDALDVAGHRLHVFVLTLASGNTREM